MGTPVPPDPPHLIDGKVYLVGVDWYQDASGKQGCDQEYQGEHRCCVTGLAIWLWEFFEMECQRGSELCTITGFSAQRKIYCHGPYDNMQNCQADL